MLGNITYPIAISGKARSGKDTVAKMLAKLLHKTGAARIDALANPMKEMLQVMFPGCSEECLYGASELRSEIISNDYIDKNGDPLTYRQALLDLGAFARKYNNDIWLHCLLNGSKKDAYVHIISDIRRKNEFDFFKKHGFVMIRVVRDDHTKIDDLSETEQDTILNKDFDWVIDNNSTIEALYDRVMFIVEHLKENNNVAF